MKGIQLSLGALVVLALPALASAGTYGMAGCGLGAVVFKDEPGMVQIVAATLNNSIVPQTSAITTGSMECTEGAATADASQKLFMRTNRAHVMRDAAVGQGEYVATWATLLGCEASAHPAFFEMSKKHHSELFADASEDKTLDAFRKAISADATLASQCAAL